MLKKTTLYLLLNHNLTIEQKEDAYTSLGISDIQKTPMKLSNLWESIPPNIDDLNEYLNPIYSYIKTNIKKGDFLLVQGEFGATYSIVVFSKKLSITTIYSTTKREVVENIIDKKTIKTSIFSHVKFREYKSL